MGSYIWLVVLGGAIAFMLLLKRRGMASAEQARALLKEGAVVVDVRSAEEFASGHMEGAVNIPLERVAEGLPEAVPDKATPVLLHCHSGGRSGMAVGAARRAGYTRAYNLGSLGRARRVVEDGADL